MLWRLPKSKNQICKERDVNMRPFMENICMHPHCMNPTCEECSFFTPKAFGIKVPKRLGLVLFLN